ncbi:methyltransferase family protein [Leminorella grimontii]|uniref:methyltransferase family protein n=1 Tax=Leminorella grimontii TaxID=82981 RepID=UPI002085AB91|nr:isoprenylcysteine carboxylmethyltransferase family protein [Leminorella grimontii]GKX59012.1 hypothetical protein SOASR031_13270 [Leminorella grimontii]
MNLSRLELRILPPVTFALCVLLALFLSWLIPVHFPLAVLAWFLCALCFVASGAIGIVSLMSFWRAKTTVNPVRVDAATTLVEGGLYAFSRNPMYLAFALLLLSLCFYLANPLTFLAVALFVAYITRFQIVPEERALEARFGERYRLYRQRVRRWI